MDWTNLVVLGLFVISCLFAIYQSRREDWDVHQQVGTVIFLVGAAIGLFLDDLLAANSSMLSWAEPIGGVIMIIGLVVSRY